MLFAAATGVLFGVTAALTKSTVVLLGRHGAGMASRWEPYALLVLGGMGFVLNQQAFQAGSLTASLPTLTVVEPVVAAVIGVMMFHESVPTTGVSGWVALVISVVAMAAATILLSRSAASLEALEQRRPEALEPEFRTSNQ